MTKSVGIVTTTYRAGESLRGFIRYHLHIGFSRIYLFFDDPADPAIEIAKEFDQVVGVVSNKKPTDEEKRLVELQLERPINLDHLIDRQQLNASIGLMMAVKDGVDWLLHIDQDELFYSEKFFQNEGETVGSLFESVEKRGYRQVVFLNHEAIVEQVEVANPFTQVSLFKRNPHIIQKGGLTKAQQKIIEDTGKFPPYFFLNYVQGKAAVRVEEGAVPEGVHRWLLPEQLGRVPKLQRKIFSDNRILMNLSNSVPAIPTLMRKGLANQRRYLFTSSNPVILHYLNCGFEAFWQKYAKDNYLEQFAQHQIDFWKKSAPIIPNEFPHYIKQGKEATRAYYEKRMVMNQPDLQEQLISQRFLIRINEPAELLASKT